MSFFSVPYYTEELLKKSNVRAKKILELGLKKIRYFTIVEEFGKEGFLIPVYEMDELEQAIQKVKTFKPNKYKSNNKNRKKKIV